MIARLSGRTARTLASSAHEPVVGVVGLWHLGCTVAACWAKLGHSVVAVDSSQHIVDGLSGGKAPIFEPGLDELIGGLLKKGRLEFTTDFALLGNCDVIFVAKDTPVDNEDNPILEPIESLISQVADNLKSGAIVVVSSQLPVGWSRRLRTKIQSKEASAELVYSPENLRLGQSIELYLSPGHVVIGADNEMAANTIAQLFEPMNADQRTMNLPSSEMTKHGINSFLATSVTLANELARVCEANGARFDDVADAMKLDPRIGQKAYLSPGLGFSGATLGRDLRALDSAGKPEEANQSLFDAVWKINDQASSRVIQELKLEMGSLKGKSIALLGMTYKPGTSTLRQSLSLRIADLLVAAGAKVAAFDPKADWSELADPPAYDVASSVDHAVSGADAIVLLTEWPEFGALDWRALGKRAGKNPLLFDTKGFLTASYDTIAAEGFKLRAIGRGDL
jgi:UDPglucose 6-dehydrogenase